jgi:hypothetical protein
MTTCTTIWFQQDSSGDLERVQMARQRMIDVI